MNRNDNSESAWLREMAELEGDGCMSVGGLVTTLAEATTPLPSSPRSSRTAFGRLISLKRRDLGLSLEKLADKASVGLDELLEIERDDETQASARTVWSLSNALGLPVNGMLELAGVIERRDSAKLPREALRFAARSESLEKLSVQEREAMEEFVRVLHESATATEEEVVAKPPVESQRRS